jgi:hypothetical protein
VVPRQADPILDPTSLDTVTHVGGWLYCLRRLSGPAPNPVIVVSQRSLGPDGLRGDAQAGRRFHLLGWRLPREMG